MDARRRASPRDRIRARRLPARAARGAGDRLGAPALRENGNRRRAVWLPEGACRDPARRFTIPATSRDVHRICEEAQRAGAIASPRSTPRSPCGIAASSRKSIDRITRTSACATRPGSATRGCFATTTSPRGKRATRSPRRSLRPLDGRQVRRMEPGPRAVCSSWHSCERGPRRPRARFRGVGASRGRSHEARDGRSARVVRRSRFRRGAAAALLSREYAPNARSALLADASSADSATRVGPRAATRSCPISTRRPARWRRSGHAHSASASRHSRTCHPPPSGADHELFVGDTCHVDVIDRDGNMVAATPSGGWLSSSPVDPGSSGFSLNTRLQMTWLDDGVPGQVAPAPAPLHDAFAVDRAARRRAAPGVRHARRRPAGPVVAHLLPAPRAARHEPAGGDRLPVLAREPLPRLVLAARDDVEPDHASSRASRTRPSTRCASDGPRRGRGRAVVRGKDRRACARERDSRGRWILKAAANPRGMQGYAVGR